MRYSAGNVKSASFDNLVLASEQRRMPFSASEPLPGLRYRNALSTGDVYNQSSPALRYSLPNECLPTIPPIEENPDKAAMHDVEEEAERLDVYQFLIQLDCHRAKLEVVRKGLQLMRELVFKIHRTDPEKRYAFPNDSWCKTIKSAMSEHEQDENIQEEGAMTITFICSISPKYKADLIRNHVSNEVSAAITTHVQRSKLVVLL